MVQTMEILFFVVVFGSICNHNLFLLPYAGGCKMLLVPRMRNKNLEIGFRKLALTIESWKHFGLVSLHYFF